MKTQTIRPNCFHICFTQPMNQKNQLVAQPCFDGTFLTWLVSGRINSIMIQRVFYYQSQIKVLKLNALTYTNYHYFRLIFSEGCFLCVYDCGSTAINFLFIASRYCKKLNHKSNYIPSPA